MAKRQQGRMVRTTHSQTGKTHRKPDKGIHPPAMAPGMRMSRSPNAWGPGGKPYFENRKNRSDRSKKRRL